MRQILRGVLCAAVVLAGVAATPAPSPVASAASAQVTPDPAVLARAKAWFAAIQSGTIDRSQLDDKMNSLMTDSLVKSLAAQVGPLGAPTAFEQVQTGTQSGSQFYVYKVTFKGGDALMYVFAVDAHAKVSGLRLTPAQ